MRLATAAGSRRDPEPLCWCYARLAMLDLQSGDSDAARKAANAALEILPDYPPALLARGRIELGRGNANAAVAPLQRAAKARPEPEYGVGPCRRAAGRWTRPGGRKRRTSVATHRRRRRPTNLRSLPGDADVHRGTRGPTRQRRTPCAWRSVHARCARLGAVRGRSSTRRANLDAARVATRHAGRAAVLSRRRYRSRPTANATSRLPISSARANSP